MLSCWCSRTSRFRCSASSLFRFLLSSLTSCFLSQDLPKAMTAAEVSEGLGLTALKNRQWHLFKTSAIKGEGLGEGLEWSAFSSHSSCACSPFSLTLSSASGSFIGWRSRDGVQFCVADSFVRSFWSNRDRCWWATTRKQISMGGFKTQALIPSSCMWSKRKREKKEKQTQRHPLPFLLQHFQQQWIPFTRLSKLLRTRWRLG